MRVENTGKCKIEEPKNHFLTSESKLNFFENRGQKTKTDEINQIIYHWTIFVQCHIYPKKTNYKLFIYAFAMQNMYV